MANKAMTKTQTVSYMAEKANLSKKEAAGFLEDLADLAVRETKRSGQFVIPGLGKLVKITPQGQERAQPSDRRRAPDPGQNRGEVPRCQGVQGRGRSAEEVVPGTFSFSSADSPGGLSPTVEPSGQPFSRHRYLPALLRRHRHAREDPGSTVLVGALASSAVALRLHPSADRTPSN